MNMLSLNDSSALLHADIERGQVVKEWRLQKDGEDIPQIAITHGSKDSQLLDGPDSMLSLASNRLCRWDMRMPDGVVQVCLSASKSKFDDYVRIQGRALCCVPPSSAAQQ